MLNNFKKIIATALTLVILLAPNASAFAQSNLEITSNPNTYEIHTDNSGFNEDTIKEKKRGVKKWLSKAALKSASWGLRHGGDIVKKVARELGGKEAEYFLKHVDDIADVLDDLSIEMSVVEDRVIDQISTGLMTAGVPSYIARTISNVFTFLVL